MPFIIQVKGPRRKKRRR